MPEYPEAPTGPADARRRNEERFRNIFEASLDPIVVTRLSDNRCVEINQECERLTGISREQAIGRTTPELHLWVDPSQRDRLLGEIHEHGYVRGLAASFYTKGGAIKRFLLSSVAVTLDGDDCLVTIARDISERDELEREIEESRAALRRVLDSILDPLAIADMTTGRYIDVNDAFLRLGGYRREEVIGKVCADVTLWTDRGRHREFARRLDAEGMVRNFEMRCRLRNGAEFTALLSGTVLELGGRRCLLTTARDITELKQTQRELDLAREAAVAASRAKSEFVSSVSHEIRTPMNAILGMADLLGETPLDPWQRRCLDTIANNGEALLDLINSILDLAKIESGRLSLEEIEFDAAEIAEQVADMLAVRAHEKGIELAVRLAPGIPAAVIGDPLRLRQVLVNLVSNAIKFTERGEVTLTAARAPEQGAPGNLLFSVADTGAGIARDKLAAIFSPFTQADSSVTRRYGGSGLGLAIAERLVGLMRGRIWVESEPGRGSIFYFTVQLGLPSASRPVRPDRPSLAGAPVLVVDDNATNRLILREMLALAGAFVAESASALEGLAAIEEARRAARPFRLLIVDCQMPGMDGFEMVKRIRREEAENQAAVLMLCSCETAMTTDKLREAGLSHYVTKPVKRRDLYAAIAEAMAWAAGGTPTARPPATASKQALTMAPQPRALRILVADDSRDNRFLINAYLKKTLYILEEAENGQDALDRFTAGRYDLVLMDAQMPVLDGYMATRAIRKWERDNGRRPTPIIALTAAALEDEVRRAMEAGCDLHVSKPVKKATLLGAIERMVGGSTAAVDNEHNDGTRVSKS